MNVVVIDSGMGGLDVAARLYERLRERRAEAQLHFVNVRPQAGQRYEGALDPEQKRRMLHETLTSLDASMAFDLLVIACNSLSALASSTPFYARNADRVLLVCGRSVCALLAEGRAPERVYLFGTQITIESGLHRAALLARGVPERRLVAQPCPGLANSIQEDHASAETAALVRRFVDEAVGQAAARGGPLWSADALLACSHYGFVQDRFRACFADLGVTDLRLLDVNGPMVRAAEARITQAGARRPGLSIRVSSQHPLGARERASLLELIRPRSAATAEALARVGVG